MWLLLELLFRCVFASFILHYRIFLVCIAECSARTTNNDALVELNLHISAYQRVVQTSSQSTILSLACIASHADRYEGKLIPRTIKKSNCSELFNEELMASEILCPPSNRIILVVQNSVIGTATLQYAVSLWKKKTWSLCKVNQCAMDSDPETQLSTKIVCSP